MPKVVVIAVILSIACGLPALTDDPYSERSGKRLYEIYCQNCHGETGQGDGPTAKVLKIRPTDLTRLTRRGDEGFPLERVSNIIDGRQRVQGHGAVDMPLWGLEFQMSGSDSNQGEEVRSRIDKLAKYLESIQQPRPPRD